MQGRQLSFLTRPSLEHGHDLRKGKRKIARPMDPKRLLHVVLRSEQARGAWSMLRGSRRRQIEALTQRIAAKHGIRIKRFANVGNHLHLLLQGRNRRAFQSFLRELPGAVAVLITGAIKGSPLARRFWDGLAYSRVVSWTRREIAAIERYFRKNWIEAGDFEALKMARPLLVSAPARPPE